MARISTGQAYGDTSRSSAAQLLGGIPMESTPGAIAQGSIAAPALQPKAAPVETFQQVGAPILGGAPKMFAPPDLPSPGQDLANLAKALGGFSTTLQSFGQSWLENRKENDKLLEQQSAAFVGQTGKYGPARTLADLTANLEKAAALGGEGAADAAKMLQIVREKQNNSVGKYWLERSLEQNSISNAALSLSDRLAATTTIKVDGKDVDLNSLPSTDPAYMAHRDKLLFGGVTLSAPGYAKNQPMILQAVLQADEVQRKRYNAAEAERQSGQVAINRYSLASNYLKTLSSGARPEDALLETIPGVQQELDRINSLGISSDAQKKLRDGYLEGLVGDFVSAARRNNVQVPDLYNFLGPVLRSVFTGPIENRRKADGTANNALRLYNALGGEAYIDQIIAKGNAAQIQDNSQAQQMAGIQEQQAYNARREAAMKDGTLSDPARSKVFFQNEMERTSQMTDYQARNARMSAIQADQRDNEATYVKPVQEQRALYYAQQLGKTYGDEAARNRLAAELQADLSANRITGAAAVSVQTSLSAQGSKEVRSYDKDINKRIDEMSTTWTKYTGSAGSYGDSAITGFESSALYKARDDARRKSQDTVYQALKDGKDPIEALNKLWSTNNWGLRYKDEPASTGIYNDGAQLMQKNTGNWSRPMDSTAARKLKDAAKGGRPLYKADPFVRDVDAYLGGNPSQNFRTLLKTLSTGSGGIKPSEVILNQLRLHQIDIPDDVRQRLTALDGEQVSAAPPSRRLTPQQNPALAGIQIAGRAMGDLLVPAAQARPITQSPLLATIGALRGATSFRGTTQVKYKQAGDYQSDPRENFFFDFNPALVSRARARVKTLTEADINALTFTVLKEAGPTRLGKLEVAANLINRSAANKNASIVSIAKQPGQYEGVFGYKASQLVSASEGRRLLGAEYDRVRKLLTQGL